MKLARCPYCGKKLSYGKAFIEKNKGEYKCTKCQRESNISIDKKIIPVFLLALVVAVIIMVYIIMNFANKSVFSFLLTLIPFIIFYIFVPFYVTLKPLKKYKDYIADVRKISSDKRVITEMINETYEDDGPIINTDIFNKIKENRHSKILEEEKVEETKAVGNSSFMNNIYTDKNDTDKTAIFNKPER